jgi:hypothetical protein
MKVMKSAVSLGLILYLCVSLSGVLLVLDASAKITPKETDEPTGWYTIQKGDTLWHIAKRYRHDPLLWREFEKYNIFSNPHLIYPEEKLQVSAMWGFPGVPMPEPEPPETVAEMGTMSEMDMLKEKFQAHLMSTESALEEIGGEVSEIHGEIHGIQETLDGLKSSMDMGGEALSMANMENSKAIAGLNDSVMGLSEKFESHVMEMESAHMDHVKATAHADEHLENIEKTLAGLKAVQDDTAGKVEKILNPPSKMKSKKRPVAFLTALVGGAAWVAMNSLGDR